MMIKTPDTFVRYYNEKAIDDDGAYDVQCVDGFRVGCGYVSIPKMPTPNNWADGYWTCKDASGNVVQSVKDWQEKYFDKIPVDQLTNGCWVVWPYGSKSHPQSHVAMYYHGQEFGERQDETNRAFVLKDTDFSDAYGGLMPKSWGRIPDYESDITIGGRCYRMYGQSSRLRTIVCSAGMNETAKIRDLDVDYEVYSKITGCNFFQNDPDNPAGQPYGMTFGDISDPIHGVYQNLDKQDSTLYLDIETGEYGDCTGVTINPDHNVFSPALIYPRGKNVQYARMVGLGHCNQVSTYTFMLRFENGSTAFGLSNDETTPNQIAADMLTITGVELVAILDGGGSAQMMRYITQTGRVEYTRETGRATAGALMMIGAPIIVDDEPVVIVEDPVETGESEEIPMEDTKPQERPEMSPVEGWTDPEPQTNLIVERIAALMSVKSILTLTLTVIFGWLIIHQAEIPEFFADIYKIVILFFFGYQTGKTEAKK